MAGSLAAAVITRRKDNVQNVGVTIVVVVVVVAAAAELLLHIVLVIRARIIKRNNAGLDCHSSELQDVEVIQGSKVFLPPLSMVHVLFAGVSFHSLHPLECQVLDIFKLEASISDSNESLHL